MQINELKVNNFGKLNNEEINLQNGINIIYGKNEAGKSTLLKFIPGILYGLSKNKNGKSISNFEKYTPWEGENFSGRINYSLDNGEVFQVFREFKKKNPIIYNSQMQDISHEFNLDKLNGIDFFNQQTGVNEDLFLSTAITQQNEIVLSDSSQASLIQKMSNLVSTGDDDISFKKTLDKISKKQNEEIGTDRTSQRPINIIDNKIEHLKNEKIKIEKIKENSKSNELEIKQLYMDLQDEKIKLDFLNEVKYKKDNNRLKNAEINFNRNLENEFANKIDNLNKEIKNNNVSKKGGKKSLKIFLLIILCAILLAGSYFYFKNNFKIIALIISSFCVICSIFILLKKDKNYLSNLNEHEKEIEILKQSREMHKIDANLKEEKLRGDIEKEQKNLYDKYNKILDGGYISKYLKLDYDDILKVIDEKIEKINYIKNKISVEEVKNGSVKENTENLANIEENLKILENEKEELISLNRVYELSKKCLKDAYDDVKQNICPQFMDKMCKTISYISNNKYNNVVFNDTDGINVETQNGSFVNVSKLSIGTIDQMYLALRLSTIEEISNEKLPIIFDEAFAYFDNERLENVLRFLADNYYTHQIIIFTCSNREADILNNLKYDYNLVTLEK